MNTVIVEQPLPSYDPILVRNHRQQAHQQTSESESSGLFTNPGSNNTMNSMKKMRVPIREVSSSDMTSPNKGEPSSSNASSAFGSSASLYSSYMSTCPSSATMGTLDEEVKE